MINARILPTATMALVLSTSLLGCDADDVEPGHDRSTTYCNVSDDPDCAALPAFTAAVDVMLSMGIDPDEGLVEVWLTDQMPESAEQSTDLAPAPGGSDPAHASSPDGDGITPYGDDLTAPNDPAAKALDGFNCAFNTYGGCGCCCYWGYGGQWGCLCSVACEM